MKQPNEIVKGLYVGSWKVGVRRGTLQHRGITHILQISDGKDSLYPKVFPTDFRTSLTIP